MAESNAEIGEVGKITKVVSGNRFSRFIDKIDPVHIPEYIVPRILDHEIKQENGISITLKGPKENLQVLFQGQDFALSFNDIVPGDSVITLQESNLRGFEANDKKIIVPSNLALLKTNPAYGFMHEGSHLWQDQDEEFLKAQNGAKAALGKKLLTNFPILSKNPEEKQVEKSAFKTIGDNEKRAAEIALYIVGKLRSQGVDILPQYPDVQSLISLVNPSLKSHENFDQKLTLSQSEIENLVAGKLPYPALKEKIDVRLTKLPGKPLAMPAS